MSSKSDPDAPPGRVTPRRPRSLAARLTWWYASSAFAIVLCATGYLYWTLSTSVKRENFDFIVDEVRLLRSILEKEEGPGEMLRLEVEWEWVEPRHTVVFVRILGEDGLPIMATPQMDRLLPAHVFPEPIREDEAPDRLVRLRAVDGTPVRAVAARAAAGPGGRTPRVIQIAVDATGEERLLATYRWRSLGLLGVTFLISVGAGRRIARRGLRGMRAIAEAARRVRAPTLQHRIDPAGLPAELSSLAETFNGMLDRLQQSFNRQARFSADIAHEIRTPVNNIRGETEVALQRIRSAGEYRETLESCLEECSRLTRLIDTLLFLGRAETADPAVQRDRVEVGEELTRVCEFYEAAAAEAGVSLAVDAPGRIDVRLNRTLLQRAVGNLVENAIAHTPAGGSVRMTAARAPSAITIDVSDSGRGIAPEHLPHVFDRFYRADRSRAAASGSVGLGLSIVKAIAELHGGRADITSRVGEGTSVRLTFPLLDDEILMYA